ncbi:MAG: radical SAM protein [Acholeplasmatales bacterium]|nr:radical SAM protein [Acholeplasmatales bacterium]
MHKVRTKTILSSKNEINVYKGCTHGCIYCDSRSKCYRLEHDFEDIEAKENAPELLEYALKRKKEKGMITMGSISDPYNPHEGELELTRKCLEVINKYKFGASILTKSDLILRDVELLKNINENAKCVVQMTLTTTDDKLCKIIEPNVCPTSRRIDVLKTLKENGIPTVVWISPLLPYITDTEDNIKKLLNVVLEVGAIGIVYYGPGLTLREGSREYFYKMLDKHFPILRRRYQREFKGRYEVSQQSNVARFDYIIKDFCEKNNIKYDVEDVFYYINNFDPKMMQLSLFDEE